MARDTRAGDQPRLKQYAALPYTIVERQVVVLLVTSRRTGRWIFPKGNRIDGCRPSDTAAIEALEEAGVKGRVERRPVGRYWTVKQRPGGSVPVEVELYPLKVKRQLADWKEARDRTRVWAPLDEAEDLLADSAITDILRAWRETLAS